MVNPFIAAPGPHCRSVWLDSFSQKAAKLRRGTSAVGGQKAKYSLGADVFHFGPESGLRTAIAGGPFRANSGHHQARASMQGKPKQVRAYETTPEPSTRGVVDIT